MNHETFDPKQINPGQRTRAGKSKTEGSGANKSTNGSRAKKSGTKDLEQ